MRTLISTTVGIFHPRGVNIAITPPDPFHFTIFQSIPPLTMASELDSNLSLFHFGSVHSDNPLFSSRVAANLKTDQEDVAGEDSTKRSAKTTKLFWKTNIRTGQHLTEMLANFKAVCSFCLNGFEHSQLWMNIMQFYKVAMGQLGKQCLTTFKTNYKHLPFALACEFQDIIHYSVTVAQSQRYLQSINTSGTDLNVNVLRESAVLTDATVLEHKAFIKRFKICGQYTSPPPAWTLFDRQRPQASSPNNNNNSNNNSSSARGCPHTSQTGSPQVGSKRTADRSAVFPETQQTRRYAK